MANKKEKEVNQKEEQQPEFVINNASVHNQAIDINQNLGSFGEEAKTENEPASEELDIGDHSAKFEMIKEKPVALDFEKFNRRRQLPDVLKVFQRKPKTEKTPGQYTGSSKLAITLDKWLRNKKSRLLVWSMAMMIIALIWAVAITLVATSIHLWKSKTDDSLINFASTQNLIIAGNVFGFISLGITFLPLFYLLITVLVGINQVYISRNYHYFLWSCIGFGLFLMIICLGLDLGVINYINSFTPAPKS